MRTLPAAAKLCRTLDLPCYLHVTCGTCVALEPGIRTPPTHWIGGVSEHSCGGPQAPRVKLDRRGRLTKLQACNHREMTLPGVSMSDCSSSKFRFRNHLSCCSWYREFERCFGDIAERQLQGANDFSQRHGHKRGEKQRDGHGRAETDYMLACPERRSSSCWRRLTRALSLRVLAATAPGSGTRRARPSATAACAAASATAG